MKMGRVEKWLTNRPKHVRKTIDHAEELLHFVSMKSKQSFLEVGSGNGAVSRHIAEKHHLNVTGIDIDPDQIKIAQNRICCLPNINFLEADATDLPFPDSTFDIVFSYAVMHHISNWPIALRELHRTLKPGGYFVCFDLFYRKWSAKMSSLFLKGHGITLMEEFNLYIEKNCYSTIYSSLSRGFVFNIYEAVYKKSQCEPPLNCKNVSLRSSMKLQY